MRKTAFPLALLTSLVLACSPSCGTVEPKREVTVLAVPGAFPILGELSEQLAQQVIPWLGHVKDPVLVLDSPGGSVQPALEIAWAVRLHGNVRCIVVGMAASGAFGILQQCKVRLMTSDAKLGTHEVKVVWNGPIDRYEARGASRALERAAEAWNTLSCWRLKITLEEYVERVRGRDWTLDAQEAIAVGAADGILQAP